MNKKAERLKKIKQFINLQRKEFTITTVFSALFADADEVSRKTIERDMRELIEEGVINIKEGIPNSFMRIMPEKFEINLTRDEIHELIVILSAESELKKKLEELL
jgi:predicted DNA-binding transcriptional regulator YafY